MCAGIAACAVSPLPLWERSDRIDRCDPGEGLRPHDRPEPLTPTLSHKGRGSPPAAAEAFSPPSKHLEIFAMLPVRHFRLETLDLGILDVHVVIDELRA